MKFAPLTLALLAPALLRAAPLPIHEVTQVRYLGGGIADSFRGVIAGRRYALKPLDRFGADRYGFGQGNPEGELVCLPLMRRLGLVAPEALLFRPGPEAPPVLAVSWVDSQLAGGPVRLGADYLDGAPTDADRAAFATLFVADAVVGNPDRHGGNFFLRTAPDGVVHPVPIDHNLALYPAEIHSPDKGPPELAAQDLDLASHRAGRLADAATWGAELVAAAQRVHDALPPAFLDGLVDQLPERIPPERREFLRRLLRQRRDALPEVAAAWAAAWTPAPPLPDDLPPLPRGIAWMQRWAPRRAAAVLWFMEALLEDAPALGPAVAGWLGLAEGQDPAAWVATALPPWAAVVEGDAAAIREGNRGWGKTLAPAYLAGAAALGDDALEAKLAAVLLEQGMRGRIQLPRFFSALYAARPASVGAGRLLRAVLAMAEALDGPGLRDQMRALRPLLARYRGHVHREADDVKRRMRAQVALVRGFARLLGKAVPEATPSQVEEGIFVALGEVPGADLALREGRAEPATLARALRAVAAEAGTPLPVERFWETVARHGATDAGAWLAGWAAPVRADDPDLSLDGLIAAGWGQDDAARLLFERLAHGAYGTWRELARRLPAPELAGRLLVPGGATPPPPALRFPWTARDIPVEGRWADDGQTLELTVPVPGLEPIVGARIPIARTPDGEAWMVADPLPADFDPAALEPLGWAAGMRLPRGLWPEG